MKSNKKDLEEENKELLEKTLQKRKKSLEPGRKEYYALAEINANIQRHNDDWRQAGHSGNTGFKHLKKPDQVWKCEELSKRGNGIDW